MLISHMLLLIATVLCWGGACEEALRSIGSTKLEGLFVLLCLAALDRFRISPADGVVVSPACAAAAVLFAAVCLKRRGSKILPAALALAFGICTAPLAAIGSEWACYAAGALCALSALVTATVNALGISALAPVFATVLACLYISGATGFEIEITEYCLSAQLAGIMLSLAAAALKERYRTTVRTNSYDRTIN